MARRIFSLTLAAVLGSIGVVPPGVSARTGLTHDEAARIDTLAYAQTMDISADEAEARLRHVPDFEALVGRLEAVAPDRFAGGWLEHEPAYRLVIRFTGQPDPDIQVALAEVDRVEGPVDLEFGASHTYRQLVEGQERLMPKIYSDYPDVGLEVDVTSGTVMLLGPETFDAEELRTLATFGGVPVAVEFTPSVETGHTYGGKLIDHPLEYCTTGFTVRHQVSPYITGVLTAGHCFDGAANQDGTYHETTTIDYPADYKGQRWDSNQDFQWHTTTHDELPFFWDGSAYRQQTSEKARLQMPGQPVCHYGERTGFSCGFVASITYAPSGNYCNGGPCANVWARIEGGGLKCFGGDSGGPFFWGGEAWGLYSGHISVGPDFGDCVFAIMMTIGQIQIDGGNLRVLIGPLG